MRYSSLDDILEWTYSLVTLLHLFLSYLLLVIQQLLGLETNWILAGLNIHDQHRDMRLDIDNMSYEVSSNP